MPPESAGLREAPREMPASAGSGDRARPEISVVMPCLNEEDSVGICVRKAWEGIRATGLIGEVIVADNGSSDRSVAVAEAAGARVVHQPRRGYGNAYLKGFEAARGRIVVMGDSDDSYDFTSIPELIKPIADGYDYVLGSRFSGYILPGAMSWTHRRIGNPALTAVVNALFRLRVSDAHSGFRAITRAALDKIALQCEGMEFASELVVKAAVARLRTAEVPISYHPRIGASKLRSFRDAWRHLRFLLLLSPDYLFIAPGTGLTALGFLGQFLLLLVPGNPFVLLSKVALALVALCGSRLLAMGTFARAQARDGRPQSRELALRWAERIIDPQRGPAIGTVLAVVGVSLLAAPFLAGSGALIAVGGAASSVAIAGLLMIALGCGLWFDALFLGLMLLGRSAADAVAAYPVSPASRDQGGGSADAAVGILAAETADLQGPA
jgi:hypothetical protein